MAATVNETGRSCQLFSGSFTISRPAPASGVERGDGRGRRVSDGRSPDERVLLERAGRRPNPARQTGAYWMLSASPTPSQAAFPVGQASGVQKCRPSLAPEIRKESPFLPGQAPTMQVEQVPTIFRSVIENCYCACCKAGNQTTAQSDQATCMLSSKQRFTCDCANSTRPAAAWFPGNQSRQGLAAFSV